MKIRFCKNRCKSRSLNLKMATHWHLRGCLRGGMERAEVKQIQSAIEAIAKAYGTSLSKIGTVANVEVE